MQMKNVIIYSRFIYVCSGFDETLMKGRTGGRVHTVIYVLIAKTSDL